MLVKPIIIFSLLLLSSAADAAGLSYDSFHNILSSELEMLDNARSIYELENGYLMDHLLNYKKRYLKVNKDDKIACIICNSAANISGYERIKKLQYHKIVQKTNGIKDVLYNGKDMTCVLSTLSSSSELLFAPSMYEDVAVQALTVHTKLRIGSVQTLEEDLSTKEMFVNVCPGVVDASNAYIYIDNILQGIKESGVNTQRFLWGSSSTQLFHRKYDGLRNSTLHRGLFTKWSRVLSEGLHADHKCSAMFESLATEYNGRDSFSIWLTKDITPACTLSLMIAFASQDVVCSVESTPLNRLLDYNSQWITQSGVEHKRSWFNAGLNGEGQVIQISDSGLDTNHCLFWDSTPGEQKDGTVQSNRRKVIQYVAFADDTDLDGHGSHVCGTAAGHCAKDGIHPTGSLGDGLATSAKLSFFDIGEGDGCCFVPNAMTLFSPGYDESGAKFHSASWGHASSSYDQQASDFDDYSYNHLDFLISVAAGNDGEELKSVLSPAIAKNVLTVGASESAGSGLEYSFMKGYQYLAFFSARGPTPDKRIGPDLIAPGFSILSADGRSNEEGETALMYMLGTSMATPAVSGAAALVRQYFLEGFGGIVIEPSAHLVKAVLLNGAESLHGISNKNGSISPVADYDNNQGYGRINLSNSLPLANETDFQAKVFNNIDLLSGHVDEYTYAIYRCTPNEVSSKFSVTIAWADPPGKSGCKKCLIDDIDLEVEMKGFIYYPNGLAKADNRNTNERVQINVVEGNEVTVRVRATNISKLSVKYNLVVTGCLENHGFEPTVSPIPSSTPTTGRPSIEPSGVPSSPPNKVCNDISGWKDTYDDECSWYEANEPLGCPNWDACCDAGFGPPSVGCCHCGGGIVTFLSSSPTIEPSLSLNPSLMPTSAPSFSPSNGPSQNPSAKPSLLPSEEPTRLPSHNPTQMPTAEMPSVKPTTSASPSVLPSINDPCVLWTDQKLCKKKGKNVGCVWNDNKCSLKNHEAPGPTNTGPIPVNPVLTPLPSDGCLKWTEEKNCDKKGKKDGCAWKNGKCASFLPSGQSSSSFCGSHTEKDLCKGNGCKWKNDLCLEK